MGFEVIMAVVSIAIVKALREKKKYKMKFKLSQNSM
jgi:hypothetical protein